MSQGSKRPLFYKLYKSYQVRGTVERPYEFSELFQKDVWVPDIRHLSTVGYTYWTIGYALSSAGAESLLRPRPLSKMVPVDEYIPIMGDVHPNREWSAAFEVHFCCCSTLNIVRKFF